MSITLEKLDEATRPIIGIENRTAEEAFGIMCDRIRSLRATLSRSGEAVAAEPFCYVYTEPDFLGDMNNAPVQGYTDFSDGPKPGYEPLYKGASPPSVPTGYKLMPEEPTQTMLNAGVAEKDTDKTYRAMISAAPPAPASQERVKALEEAAREAIDLLAERKYGSHARSPGHNARLVLERALKDPTHD